DRIEALPRDGLVLARVRLAAPLVHAEELQPHGAVRIGEHARDPGIGLADIDAELLVQLARQRLRCRLAGLDLAAGKLPVAGVHLAGGTLREQERAVRTLEHRGRDLNYFFFGCRPAQSRANW